MILHENQNFRLQGIKVQQAGKMAVVIKIEIYASIVYTKASDTYI